MTTDPFPEGFDLQRFEEYAVRMVSQPDDERLMYKAFATRLAGRAGLDLIDAIGKLIELKSKPFSTIIEDHENSADQRARIEQRHAKDEARRAYLLELQGDPEGVMVASPVERRLSLAVEHLKDTFGGMNTDQPRWQDMSDDLRALVMAVEPKPTSPGQAIAEIEAWRALERDRKLFWNYDHDWWIEARLRVLEHVVETYPVATFHDIRARIRHWQMRLTSGIDMSPDEEVCLQRHLLEETDRLIGDPFPLKTAQIEHTTATARTAEVRRILIDQPTLSNRRIAKMAGVSPQTVANWRRVVSM